MKNKIKIAVIGGTGKSGKYLVKLLIAQGFPFKILVRNPDHFQINHPLVEVVHGDVTDYHSVHSLLNGCNAVISTLGMGIPASEPTIFSQSTTHILRAMHAHHIHRYIVTTGLNVDVPHDAKSAKTAAATEWMRENYPISTANKQLELDILSDSNIDWTLVRLPMIELTDHTGQIETSLEDCPGDKISATDLAHFLMEQLYSNSFIKKSPFIASV